MAAAYSVDLRTKILEAYQNQEGSQRVLAARFKVSLSFIRNLLRQYRKTGEIAPKPQGGDRRSKLKASDRELLKQIVAKKNDIYLREMQVVIESDLGIKVSTSSLCRTLDRWKLRRKKNSNRQRTPDTQS